MKRIFITMTLLLNIGIISNAQDKDAIAKAHYINAEDLFNKGSLKDYDLCITELQKAETELGNSNSKILYLKVKALYELAVANKIVSYINLLDQAIKHFFEITNSTNYPEEKYMEIVHIKNQSQATINETKFTQQINTNTKSISKVTDSFDSALIKCAYYKVKEKDNKLAEDCYVMLIEKGSIKAMVELGNLYTSILASESKNKSERELKGFFEKAETSFRNAKEKGSIEASYQLGQLYYFHHLYRDIDKNLFKTKALKEFLFSAENGYRDAYYFLGQLYSNGEGVKVDKQRAFNYYLKASTSMREGFNNKYTPNAIRAMERLGSMYEFGIGVEKDERSSLEWYQKAKNNLKNAYSNN